MYILLTIFSIYPTIADYLIHPHLFYLRCHFRWT